MIGYRFQNNAKPWSDVVLAQDLRPSYTKRLLLMRGPFHTREHAADFGPYRSRQVAISRAVTKLTAQRTPGLELFTANARGKGVRCKAVELGVADTTGNYLIDQLFAELSAAFGPGIQNLGALVCKSIGSTSTPSQHSDWGPIADWAKYGFPTKDSSAGGNAIDWAYPQAVMDESFRWAIAHADALQLENVIHWPADSPVPLIWNPEGGLHTYSIPPGGSDHKGHCHADARPTRTSGDRC